MLTVGHFIIDRGADRFAVGRFQAEAGSCAVFGAIRAGCMFAFHLRAHGAKVKPTRAADLHIAIFVDFQAAGGAGFAGTDLDALGLAQAVFVDFCGGGIAALHAILLAAHRNGGGGAILVDLDPDTAFDLAFDFAGRRAASGFHRTAIGVEQCVDGLVGCALGHRPNAVAAFGDGLVGQACGGVAFMACRAGHRAFGGRGHTVFFMAIVDDRAGRQTGCSERCARQRRAGHEGRLIAGAADLFIGRQAVAAILLVERAHRVACFDRSAIGGGLGQRLTASSGSSRRGRCCFCRFRTRGIDGALHRRWRRRRRGRCDTVCNFPARLNSVPCNQNHDPSPSVSVEPERILGGPLRPDNQRIV